MITDPNQTLVEEGEHFVSIPEWILLHPQLPAPAVRLYGVLKMYARKTERAWPGRATLAGHLGCSEDSVDRYVKALRDVGAVRTIARWQAADRPAYGAAPVFLEPGPGRIQTSSIYHLTWSEPGLPAQVQGGGRKDAGTGGRKDAGTVAAPVRPEAHAPKAHPGGSNERHARATPQGTGATTTKSAPTTDQARILALSVAEQLISEHGDKITLGSGGLAQLLLAAAQNGVPRRRLERAVKMALHDGKQLAPWILQEYVAKAAAAGSKVAGW